MRPVIGIAIGETSIAAVATQRRTPVWAAEAEYDGPADLATVLTALAGKAPSRARHAVVALAAGVAVKTVAGIPAMKTPDLAAHVRLRSRRYFIQNGIPLVTNAVAEPEGVLMASGEAPLIESAAQGLAAAGLQCRAIVPAPLLVPPDETVFPGSAALRLAFAATQPASHRLQLVPDEVRASTARRARRITLRLVTAAVASVALAVASWFGADAWRLRRDHAALDALRPAITAALAVRSDLDQAERALSFVAELETQRSRHARALANLAAALPDSAFVTSLRLTARSATLTGHAASTAAVVRALEASRRFTGVRVVGSITRETLAGAEWERFAIQFEWRP